MTPHKIYLDEDVHGAFADALRLRGWVVLTTLEAGNRSATDEEQLRFASLHGYLLVTYNIRDFARLHTEWARRGEQHAGICLARQSDGLRNVRPLLRVLSEVSAAELTGQLIYLANWA